MSTLMSPVATAARHLNTRFSGASPEDCDLPMAHRSVSVPASTKPTAAPFRTANSLEALEHRFLTMSPTDESGSEYRFLRASYLVRRDEIDPLGERAWCRSCRGETHGVDGVPSPHLDARGRRCQNR